MDVTSLATAALSTQAGNAQANLGADLMRMSADSGSAVVQLLGAATQSANPLANVAAGIGTTLDISA